MAISVVPSSLSIGQLYDYEGKELRFQCSCSVGPSHRDVARLCHEVADDSSDKNGFVVSK